MAGGSEMVIGVDPSVLDLTVEYLQKVGFTVQVQESDGTQIMALAKGGKAMTEEVMPQNILVKW